MLPSTPCAASAMALQAAITGLSTESGVVAQEAQHLGRDRRVRRRAGDARREQLQEEERAGLVAVVPLVAHVQRLGDQRPQVEPARERERLGERPARARRSSSAASRAPRR